MTHYSIVHTGCTKIRIDDNACGDSSINENKDLINNTHYVVFSKHCVFNSELLGGEILPEAPLILLH